MTYRPVANAEGLRRHIFHLTEPEYVTFSDDYFIPPSLREEGVVKCAEWDQLPKVVNTKFRSHNDLLLLTIDIEQVEHSLIRESREGHREPFPHVYAPIPWTAIMFHRPYLRHLEESMWIERTRYNRTWMERILHNDYEEFGASGRRHARWDVIDTPRIGFKAEIPLPGYKIQPLSESSAMITYTSIVDYDGVKEQANRVSIWVRSDSGWQIRYHQGTRLATWQPRLGGRANAVRGV